jgi:site-specific DNA recombinase
MSSRVNSMNGHVTRKAVLYARVSTEEQARNGYSLAQQLDTLRQYAAREGYEVQEEVADPGQSGASFERPGMDRVRDLVAEGGVSVVLAQDRDRFAREPAYHYLLRREFEEYGTKIRALNDRGDDSPEGELTDGILDQLAKFERAKTAERTRRGKLRKAREGKVIAGSFASYGFRYNAARDGYEINEAAMETVRRIFRMIATEGATLHAVKRTFEREGLPTPKGNSVWSQTFLRSLILDDVYKPHTFEEIAALVSPEVATRLNPRQYYGIWWYNKYQAKVIKNVKTPDGYKTRRAYEEKARQEWVAVPVPDAGVTRELVEAAREAIKGNRRPSSAGRRFWELSGGILYCAECARRMTPHPMSTNRGGKLRHYYYYVCQRKIRDHNDACTNKSHRAEKVESRMWEFVSDLLKDPNRLRAGLDRMIEQERDGSRGKPEWEVKTWLEKLAEADRRRDGYLDLTADGLMNRDELRTKLAALEETRKTAERELVLIRDRKERLDLLERDKEALLASYANALPETLDKLTSEERRQIYAMLRLRVNVGSSGTLDVSGVFGGEFCICKSEPTLTC